MIIIIDISLYTTFSKENYLFKFNSNDTRTTSNLALMWFFSKIFFSVGLLPALIGWILNLESYLNLCAYLFHEVFKANIINSDIPWLYQNPFLEPDRFPRNVHFKTNTRANEFSSSSFYFWTWISIIKMDLTFVLTFCTRSLY